MIKDISALVSPSRAILQTKRFRHMLGLPSASGGTRSPVVSFNDVDNLVILIWTAFTMISFTLIALTANLAGVDLDSKNLRNFLFALVAAFGPGQLSGYYVGELLTSHSLARHIATWPSSEEKSRSMHGPLGWLLTLVAAYLLYNIA